MGNPTLNLKPGAEWVPESNVDMARSDVDFSTGGFCEGVAYDVLAYYKPYTVYRGYWGIFFILRAVLRDLERLRDVVQNDQSGIKPEEGLLALIIQPKGCILA